jgi:hypothetical protein
MLKAAKDVKAMFKIPDAASSWIPLRYFHASWSSRWPLLEDQ